MGDSKIDLQDPKIFQPDADWAQQLATNRAGQFTPAQRTTVIIAALGSSFGLFFVGMMFAYIGWNFFVGFKIYNLVTVGFFSLFALAFLYLLLTMYFNARVYVPDMLAKTPVKQAKGKLQIRMAARERQLLPFSYIVGEYSFAPFEVPYGVPMEKGRKYVVYYAGHSRLFLNIEPVDYDGRE